MRHCKAVYARTPAPPPPHPTSNPVPPTHHTHKSRLTAGYIITGNFKIITDSRLRNIISKGPKYRFPSNIDFNKCREEIAAALNKFGNRWCKREYVEHKSLKEWKLSILKLVNKRISFYSQNTNALPPKPKISLRHFKLGIQEFHKKYALASADKAANDVVVV